IAVEDDDPGVPEDLHDLVLLSRFVVVIPQDADDGDAERSRQLAREHARLLRQAVVRQVAAEDQDVSLGAGRGEDRLERALGRLRAVQVTDGGDAHESPGVHSGGIWTGWGSDRGAAEDRDSRGSPPSTERSR